MFSSGTAPAAQLDRSDESRNHKALAGPAPIRPDWGPLKNLSQP